MRRIVPFVPILLAAAASAQAPRPMTLVDLIEVPSLQDPQLAPGGDQVLYALSRADWKANKRVSHIWRARVDGAPIQMTNGPEGESSPRWSPDGRRIAFLAKRGESSETQVYLIAADGGEAVQLTEHVTSVSNIAWAPDGAAIYFTASDAKSAEEREREKQKDDVYTFDEDYKQSHLWRIELEGRREQLITQGDYSVTAYSVSLDGRRLTVQRAPNPLLGSAANGEVWVMDANGANPLRLTTNSVGETGARLSPDNSQVLFIADANQAFEPYYNGKLFLAPAGGGEARLALPDFPYEVDEAEWSKDGRAVFLLVNLGVHAELFELDLSSKRTRQLTDGEHTVRSWSYDPRSGRHTLVIDDATSPGDVWLLRAGVAAPERVTRVFDYLAQRYRLPKQERVEWKGTDGVTIEGLLYYPLEYQAGRSYPLVVQTHGGPTASDKFAFGGIGSYVQVLTAKGYAVLKPNYRGSTGYGDVFMRDMVGHYFKNAHLDVLAGVDYLIRRGIADSTRMVKMGWSAGGHMTNKVITYTTRFKAASSGAGAMNWISMYAQSDIRSYRTPWFGGTPWQANAPIQTYWDNSPLKDVWKVKTPTIILVGERDPRVPMPQSVELYRALQANGVPTHLYVAPREPHGWTELRHQLFKANVELAWFEKYALNREYVWEKPPSTPDEKGPKGQEMPKRAVEGGR